ncbi:division plane positioning ATPase MipZ [Roseiconus lacunae]|uniref:division plane positioning ATPase MipZ n=1 Tax=Roseiconus lacunae TaxID=2605694 RepID=UPI0011F21AE9|nr:division plane positioning ATPase MipZ [Roseiconus lacunae]MCD0458361.1 hypothetical protein [Roseiconus lacunae]WRQ52146.1 division plane positioning ATPase MipZ [Stieleria sp. HD01]
MSIKQSFIGAYARQRAGRRPDPHNTPAPVQRQPQSSEPLVGDDDASNLETQTWIEGKDDKVLRIDQPATSDEGPVAAEPSAVPSEHETESWANQSIAEQWLATESHVITAPLLDPSFQNAVFEQGFTESQPPDDEAPQTDTRHHTRQSSPASSNDETVVAADEDWVAEEQPVAETIDHTASAVTEPESPALRWSGAAWEVDAFSIPRHVADTFFEEKFFRSIADHLGQSVRSGLRSILVTSLCDGEGRSTTTLGTAIAAAATGLSVAIIDVDFDAPGQAEQLRLDIDSDWVTAIRQGQPLESIAIASLEDGVTLLPLLYSDESSVPATSMDLDRLIDHLHGCFDLILFDGPAVNSWATARLASSVDSCLIVRDARLTGKSNVALAAATLRRQGVQGIGVVDNFA